ncbi:alpha/beta hydrolase family protein [Paenibacillus sp. CAU 1782]
MLNINPAFSTKRRLLWLISFIVLIAALAASAVILFSKLQSTTPDGTIISSELIKVPGQNPNINIHKIFYYSDGVKVEALLTEPKWSSGQYPMIVKLHGGLIFGAEPVINNLPENILDGYNVENISKESHKVITLYPQYRGYGESDGQPQGLVGSTLDAQNAIKAVQSMVGEKWQQDELYLIGYSFGGGIALRTASERNDVKAIATVAPYVGSDTIVRWLEENPEDETLPAPIYRNTIESFRNEALRNKGTLLNVIPQINAPVLFLQGNYDHSIMWEMVQLFVNEMEEADKTVKFIKYPSGQHNLIQQFPEAEHEIWYWFNEYGLEKW